MGIRAGLKGPLLALFGSAGVAGAVRYGIMVLFAGAVWPAAFRYMAAGAERRDMKKSNAAALRRSTAFFACQKGRHFFQFVLEILGIHPQPVKVLEPLRLLETVSRRADRVRLPTRRSRIASIRTRGLLSEGWPQCPVFGRRLTHRRTHHRCTPSGGNGAPRPAASTGRPSIPPGPQAGDRADSRYPGTRC